MKYEFIGPDKRYLTQAELAAELGVSVPKLKELIARGQCPPAIEASGLWMAEDVIHVTGILARGARLDEERVAYLIARSEGKSRKKKPAGGEDDASTG